MLHSSINITTYKHISRENILHFYFRNNKLSIYRDLCTYEMKCKLNVSEMYSKHQEKKKWRNLKVQMRIIFFLCYDILCLIYD